MSLDEEYLADSAFERYQAMDELYYCHDSPEGGECEGRYLGLNNKSECNYGPECPCFYQVKEFRRPE